MRFNIADPILVATLALWPGSGLPASGVELPSTTRPAGDQGIHFEIKVDTVLKDFDGQSHWFDPRAGVVPACASGGPLQVIFMQRAFMSASDYFSGYSVMMSRDMGATWSGPREIPGLGWRDEAGGVIHGINSFTSHWHAPTNRLLAFGHTVRYVDGKLMREPRPRETGYTVLDPATGAWQPWKAIDMPDREKFFSAGAGAAQWLSEPDGSLLVPIYFKARSEKLHACYSATVLRCAFDGTTVRYLSHGDELKLEVPRGFCEPSLTKFNDRYFLTIRNDEKGYVSVSPDAVRWSKPFPWAFDDDKDLGSYNTQQHWATHSDGLFLVYTRRGANNDRVFRHRAPLFIAQVDPDRLCVIRASERVVIPERGAPMGNFGVAAISERETWVTASEEMLAWLRAKPGSADGSVFLARIIWSRPNKALPACSSAGIPASRAP